MPYIISRYTFCLRTMKCLVRYNALVYFIFIPHHDTDLPIFEEHTYIFNKWLEWVLISN